MKLSFQFTQILLSVAVAVQHIQAEYSQFKHFIADNSSHTCSADSHAMPFNNQIRGVSLGGWLVLEAWITPSLFFQFLGGNESTTAVDIVELSLFLRI